MAVLTATQVYAVARMAGATDSEAVILTAIAKGESGWRTDAYNPVNRDLSYGLWQINMKGAMGPARRKTFGIATNEELFDPRTNAKAALSLLRSQGWRAWSFYNSGGYKKYLLEANTASGQLGGRLDDGHLTQSPTWRATIDSINNQDYGTTPFQVVKHSGGDPYAPAQAPGAPAPTPAGASFGASSASGSGFGGGTTAAPPLPPNATPEQVTAYIQQHYPQAAPFLANPEIAAIFTAPGAMQMDSVELEAKLRATTYWQTHGPESRAFDALIGTAPDAANELVDQTKRTLTNMFAKQGVTLADGDANVYARQMIRAGYINLNGQVTDPNAVQNLVADHITGPTGKLSSGEASNTADAMVALAKQYLVPIARSDAEQWSLNIMRGTASQESFQSWLTGLAKARFASQPDMLAALDSGMTPSAYFTGHRNAVAGLLEVSPDQIDLTDPKWSWMIETVDKNGNRRAPTLGEVQQMARDRPEFATTQQYQQTSSDYALNMSKFIGAAA